MSESREGLKPRILRLEIGDRDDGKTIKEYLMKKIGFSSKQLSRFKYRKDGILLNGEKRYVSAVLRQGDVLQIRLTRGGEPAEEDPGAGQPGAGSGGHSGEYLRARDGRLQKIWAAPAAWLADRYPLRILYEDQDILAADKPSGVVCHPSPGHYNDTLSNQVADHLGRIGQELDVRVTGRLDRDTSGIVIFALNTETAAQLIKQRQAELMSKLYVARVRGTFGGSAACREETGLTEIDAKETGIEETGLTETGIAEAGLTETDAKEAGIEETGITGTIDRPLRRESPESFRMVVAGDGKAARTHYRVLRNLEDGTSIVTCRIEHGRTHQIRVHMASIGHPIVGDRLYGPEAETAADDRTDRAAKAIPVPEDRPLMLHAWRASLRQPFTGEEIHLEAALPDWAGREPGLQEAWPAGSLAGRESRK